jgi:hypothetical protein
MSPTDPSGTPADDIALTLLRDGEKRPITIRELAVSNKIAGDALLALLIEKGFFTLEEFQTKIQHLSEDHYRPGEPGG